MIKVGKNIVLRDLKKNYSSFQNLTLILGFYLSLIVVFPISLGNSSSILTNFASSILWVCLLLTSLSFLNNVFEDDLKDGWLDQVIISNFPLEIIVVLKAISHWISIILPLIIMTPIILIMLDISLYFLFNIILILIIGSITLSLLGVMTSSLVLGSKNTNVLSFLIVLPLCIPVLIFGVSATNTVINNENTFSHFYLLCTTLTLVLIFSPIASAQALKIASENS